MKSRKWMSLIAMGLLTALAIPVQLAARHTHFKLIDTGTLGGPNSGLSGPGLQILNRRGTLAGFGNTAAANPNPGCFVPFQNGPDCFVENPFVWQNGAVVTLPVLPGGTNGQTDAISSSGLISGWSENGIIDPMIGLPESRAVLWTKNHQIIDLGTVPGGTESLAITNNSRGQVVGFSNNDVPDPFSFLGLPTQTRAFLWQNGAMQDLGTLGGPDALAQFVNERGQVAGFSYTSTLAVDPFLWDNGAMIDLGTLGGTFSLQTGLNNRGQVVGTMNLAGDVNKHGFFWDRGSLLDLGTLGGDNSEADFISDSGDIVGRADVPGSQSHHAFLWKNGVMTDLGLVAPGPCSTGKGVNSKDQVLVDTGICGVGGGPPGFSKHGRPMVDINTLVLPGSDLVVVDTFYINERGEIAGLGALPNGDVHAVLLVPAGDEEIAAATGLHATHAASLPAHPLIPNAENSDSSVRNRTLNLIRRMRRLP